MQQRLAPGTKLPESQLCELFGVSRSVVRKVLQRLAHDHIVELRPQSRRRRSRCRPPRTRGRSSRPAAWSRRRPCGWRRSTPAPPTSPSCAASWPRSTRRCTASTSRRGPGWRAPSTCASPRCRATRSWSAISTEIVSRCSLIVALYEPPGNAACEHDEHERIVDCIARRDGEGAAALMVEHLRSAGAQRRAAAGEPGPEPARDARHEPLTRRRARASARLADAQQLVEDQAARRRP